MKSLKYRLGGFCLLVFIFYSRWIKFWDEKVCHNEILKFKVVGSGVQR